jgi:hypothetical protein
MPPLRQYSSRLLKNPAGIKNYERSRFFSRGHDLLVCLSQRMRWTSGKGDAESRSGAAASARCRPKKASR